MRSIIVIIVVVVVVVVVVVIIVIIIIIIIIDIIIIIAIISRPHRSLRRVSLLLPALCHTPNLSCQWWVDLSGHMGNEITDHQLCGTDFLGWKSAFLFTSSISGVLKICPKL